MESLDGVRLTGCGLVNKTTVLDYQPFSYVTNAQINLNFTYSVATNNTYYVIVARNDATGQTSVYQPIQSKLVQNKLNVTTLTCGIVFGVIGLIAIVLLVWWIMRMRRNIKQNQLYDASI